MVEGFADGVAVFAPVNPVAGDHVYVAAPDAPKLVGMPGQIETFDPAFTVGKVFTEICT